jgi:hypothetical protein|tara:strand:+ start:845 stop:1183 length:339 start_codon:yes stop_codon:yes gene_type:complete
MVQTNNLYILKKVLAYRGMAINKLAVVLVLGVVFSLSVSAAECGSTPTNGCTVSSNTTFDVTFSKIFSFQNSWLSYDNKRANLNTLTNLSAAKGYWIKANQDTTWTFNGTFS